MTDTRTHIWNLLQKRYPSSAFALMREVSDAAGFNRSRSADYVAVNLWPSRGLAIEGIEVKSYRSDWLNELKNPEKAQNIFQYCDYFWLLTSNDKVALLSEIPEPWGWLCVQGDRLLVKKPAPKLTPLPVSRDFWVALLKRASNKKGWIEESKIKDEIEAAREAGKKLVEMQRSWKMEDGQKAIKAILEFEKASGIKLDSWNAGEVGKAINLLRNDGIAGIKKQLEEFQRAANRISSGIELALSELNSLPPENTQAKTG